MPNKLCDIDVIGGTGNGVTVAGPAEQLAILLAEVLGVPEVSTEAHFFEELGADSMLMAQFCARVRKQPDLPRISMKDIYRNPSLTALAAALATTAGAAPTALAAPNSNNVDAPVTARMRVLPPPPAQVGRFGWWCCGLAQALLLAGEVFLAAVIGTLGWGEFSGEAGLLGMWLRAAEFAAISTTVMFAFPILAKWSLVGRMRPGTFPLWSGKYLRFWIVKVLVAKNPLLHLMTGSPLYTFWLRALGARIGAGAVILTRDVACCPDLFTVGAGTVIRKGVIARCYHVEGGTVRTGTVTLGEGVVVGDKSVLDVDTSIGDRAQLGHASALHAGQSVPAGQRWHGSPAMPGTVDFSGPPALAGSSARRIRFALLQVVSLVGVGIPFGLAVLEVLDIVTAHLLGMSGWGGAPVTLTFCLRAVFTSILLLVAAMLSGLLRVTVISRILARGVKPGQVYPLYGWAHAMTRGIARTSNSKFFTDLLGDSSAIVPYLKAIGYRLTPVRQTGTNFGQRVNHDHPLLVSVGTGTVVADGLSVVNAEYSATSLRVSPARIGADNFLGNHIAYPAAGRTGDNCLLATKVMVPISGPVREGVGLLGSPAFEIPRSVARDNDLIVGDPAELRRRLAAKNRHNTMTIALYLLTRWIYLLGALIYLEAAAVLVGVHGPYSAGALGIGAAMLSIGWFVTTERCCLALAALRPQGVSIYEREFWRHERYWKVRFEGWLPIFDGTTVKPVLLRLLGARVGKRVLDDGAALPEPVLVSVGDGVTLNASAILQSHSQEDDAFKSDRIKVESGVTVGVSALVHYGVTMGQGSSLAADSFLMKGEEVPPGARWGGNPARELSEYLTTTTVLEVAA